jgi:GTP-binding protein EngB required for normal cell division
MSKTITITLSDTQLVQLSSIHSTRKDRTEREIIDLIIERGIYALVYRTKYNKVKYANTKAEMAEFRAFKALRKDAIAEEEVSD